MKLDVFVLGEVSDYCDAAYIPLDPAYSVSNRIAGDKNCVLTGAVSILELESTENAVGASYGITNGYQEGLVTISYGAYAIINYGKDLDRHGDSGGPLFLVVEGGARTERRLVGILRSSTPSMSFHNAVLWQTIRDRYYDALGVNFYPYF